MIVLQVIGAIVGLIVLVEVLGPLAGYVVENAPDWWKYLTSSDYRRSRQLQNQIVTLRAARYDRFLEGANRGSAK